MLLKPGPPQMDRFNITLTGLNIVNFLSFDFFGVISHL